MTLISLWGCGLRQRINNYATRRNVLQDHLFMHYYITNIIVSNINVFGFSMILRVLGIC